MSELPNDILKRFKDHGQEHVFAYWDELGDGEREHLLNQCRDIDLAEVGTLVETYVQNEPPQSIDFEAMEPADYLPHYKVTPEFADEWADAKGIGEDALRMGKVAAFTVAGGQGTRLGYDGPKGTFPVTPVREASLFEVFGGKIECAEKR